MKRARLKKLFVGIAAVVLALVCCLFYRSTQLAHRLTDACAGADRVVLDTNTYPSGRFGANVLPSFEIRGSDAATALLKSIKLQHGLYLFSVRCACYGDAYIHFYRGDKLLASINYRHRKHLYWKGWVARAVLTPGSRKALEAWIAQHAGQSFDAILAEQHRLIFHTNDACDRNRSVTPGSGAAARE